MKGLAQVSVKDKKGCNLREGLIFMMVIRIVLYILIAIITLLFLFITIPFGYRIDGSESRIHASISWTIFNVIYTKWLTGEEEFSIGVFGYRKMIPINKDRDEKEKMEKRKSRKKFQGINLFKDIKTDVIRQVFTLIRRVFHSIMPREFILDARVGFEEPMYTGIMYAIYCEFYYLLRSYKITIRPEFGGREFSGRFVAEGRLWILSIITAFIRFIISKPVFRVMKNVLKGKLFGKKGVASNVRL